MTVISAIQKSKRECLWNVVFGEPSSVRVLFENNDGETDETELDLFSSNFEKELSEIWEYMCPEFRTAPDKILELEAYGYIK